MLADLAPQVSRFLDPKNSSATALMVIKTDSEPPAALLNRLRARPGILRAKALVLPRRADWAGQDAFFRTYTQKVWGIPGSEIRSLWAALPAPPAGDGLTFSTSPVASL